MADKRGKAEDIVLKLRRVEVLQIVNWRAKLTPYRRPILTPLYVSRAGPEPTELIML